MIRKTVIILTLCVPLPACNVEDIHSAGSKAQVACESAIRVCKAAGGILGWELAPVSVDFPDAADYPAAYSKPAPTGPEE